MAHPNLWGTTDTRNGLPTTTRESPDFSHGECQRAKNNLTQAELGKQLNMTRETVNRIENNRYKKMTPIMQAKIELLLRGNPNGER